jgi:uncharacterized protein YdhG (YjbR/CyaY superfamily)
MVVCFQNAAPGVRVFFPTAEGMEAFRNELTGYERSKGTVRFPLDGPLPLGLITRIVQHRVGENRK